MSYILLIIPFFIFSSVFSQNTFRYINLNTFLWSVKDISGKTIIEPNYKIGPLKNGRYVVSKTSMQQGIFDEKGVEILSCEYFTIYDESKDTIIVRKNGKLGVLNSKMEWIIPLKYKYLRKEKNFHIIAEDYLFGILNSNLELTVPMTYSTIYHPNSLKEHYFLAEKNQKRGLIDINNNIIIPIDYDFLSHFDNFDYYVGGNIVESLKESQSKVFDSQGKLIFYIENNGVKILTKDRFAVQNDKNLWGVFDKDEKQKIAYQYNNIYSCGDDNFYIVQNNQLKWGAVDDNDKVVIPFHYNETFYFKGDAAFVKNETGKYGFINKKGINTTEYKYDYIDYLNTGYYRVQIKNKNGLVDKNGIELIVPYYDFINAPFNNLVIAGKDKKYFLLKLDNLASTPTEEYEYIGDFTDKDLILVKKNGLYGFIDYEGNIVVPIIYENARSYMDGYASVKLKNESYVINKSGQRI